MASLAVFIVRCLFNRLRQIVGALPRQFRGLDHFEKHWRSLRHSSGNHSA
jgi:hypothetical protein